MPFTLSHPVYAVVMRRAVPSFSLTGLVLGSMIPDMEYYMAMDTYKTIGHSFPGFLLLGLPLSISVAYAFHNVIKPFIPRLLPAAGGLDRYAASRIGGCWKPAGAAGWMIFVVSLFFGFLNHMFMDGLSHTNGWLANLFPELRRTFAGIKGYSWIQYLLSGIGLALPVRWLYKDWRKWRGSQASVRIRRKSEFGRKSGFRITLLLCAGLLFSLNMLLTRNSDDSVTVLVAGCSSLLFGWYGASLLHSGLQRGGRLQRLSALLSMLAVMGIFKAVRTAAVVIFESSLLRLLLWIAFIWTWSACVLLISRWAAEGIVWPRWVTRQGYFFD